MNLTKYLDKIKQHPVIDFININELLLFHMK